MPVEPHNILYKLGSRSSSKSSLICLALHGSAYANYGHEVTKKIQANMKLMCIRTSKHVYTSMFIHLWTIITQHFCLFMQSRVMYQGCDKPGWTNICKYTSHPSFSCESLWNWFNGLVRTLALLSFSFTHLHHLHCSLNDSFCYNKFSHYISNKREEAEFMWIEFNTI